MVIGVLLFAIWLLLLVVPVAEQVAFFFFLFFWYMICRRVPGMILSSYASGENLVGRGW